MRSRGALVVAALPSIKWTIRNARELHAFVPGIRATSKPAGVRRPRLMYRGTGRRERRRPILSARTGAMSY
jgi:hypothetical protein